MITKSILGELSSLSHISIIIMLLKIFLHSNWMINNKTEIHHHYNITTIVYREIIKACFQKDIIYCRPMQLSWARIISLTPLKRTYHLHFSNLPGLQKSDGIVSRTKFVELFKIGHFWEKNKTKIKPICKLNNLWGVLISNYSWFHIKCIYLKCTLIQGRLSIYP